MSETTATTDLTAALPALGYIQAPELIEELAPAVQRGHHIAALAAEGSGSEILYGLAAARVTPADEGVQGLVLTTTPERSARCARALHVIASECGLEVLVWPPHSDPDVPSEQPRGHLIVGRPEPILADVRAGKLGLGGLRLLVIDDVASLGDAWPVVEAILETCEAETQRIACSHRADPRLDDLIERQLPRARRWPTELLPAPGTESGPGSGTQVTVRIAMASSEEGRLVRLAQGLHQLAKRVPVEHAIIHCSSQEAAERAGASLAGEGFRLAAEPGAAGIRVTADPEAAAGAVDVAALFGLPAQLETLRGALGEASRCFAVVDSRHAAQLELMVRRLGWKPRTVGAPIGETAVDEIHRFRSRVRAQVESVDLGGPLLLLEPLLEEFGAEAVAAALASMVRATPEPAGDSPGAAPADATESRETKRVLRRAWTTVFINIGKRDGAGPGDLVGAITGETGAAGAQVGRVEMRGSYSLVDVDSLLADEVVRKLSGTRIKGRDVTAKLDRGPGRKTR
jgi:ATP-dependent RNA helicase DeaD